MSSQINWSNVTYLSRSFDVSKSIISHVIKYRLLSIVLMVLALPLHLFGQGSYASVLKDIERRGGVEIGQLEWQLKEPGWWQYSVSCDNTKWISVGDNYEPRDDGRARCDLQVHDGKTEVAPTLTRLEEISVPADGRVLIYIEVKEEEGYELEPNIFAQVYSQSGAKQGIHGWVGGKNKHITPAGHDNNFFRQVFKGDKIVLKSEARFRTGYGAGWNAYFPCEVKVKAFLLPSVGQVLPPDLGDEARLVKPQPGILYFTDTKCK